MAESDTQNRSSEWEKEDFLSLLDVADDDNDSTSSAENDDRKEKSEDDMDLSDDDDYEVESPPWIDKRIDYKRMHPVIALHNEIVSFCRMIEPTREEIALREELIEEFEVLVKETFGNEAEFRVFGSQSTGLFLPSSDIDCVILIQDNSPTTGQGEQDHDAHKQDSSTGNFDASAILSSPLQRLAHSLSGKWRDKLSYLEVIENTAVPLVKFTHAGSNVSFDVSFNETKGPMAANLMKTYMESLPPLRPLTFVLKYFLKARGLNEPYSGGIGSYLLQLMIVAHLQQRERESKRSRRQASSDLGSLLIEFFELFGFEFNYMTTGISVRHDGFFFPKGAKDMRKTYHDPARPFLLAMENPLDIGLDVGSKSFRIQMITRSFEVAFRMLIAHTTIPPETTRSILATILPPSQEMRDRKR